MFEATIPLDLLNPGQVFGCIGFAEACETLFDDYCEMRFDYRERETVTTFTLFTERTNEPFKEVLRFLHEATASTVVPMGGGSRTEHLSTKKWNVPEVPGEAGFSPSGLPPSPATLPVAVERGSARLVLNHWADGAASGRDNVKFWGGSGGNPASAIAREMISSVASLANEELTRWSADPFSFSAPMTGGFRFDWRRDYIPLDAGFSPNNHSHISMVGFPLTELLAATGLQHARPTRAEPRNKLRYRYSVSSARLPLSFVRPTLGGSDLGFPKRDFQMLLGWPGQAGQSRCIIDAREES